jgi:hypothetical protein
MQNRNDNASSFVRNVTIKKTEVGMFYASCVEDPAFFVAARSMDELSVFIPVAFHTLYKERDKLETKASPIKNVNTQNTSWQISRVTSLESRMTA